MTKAPEAQHDGELRRKKKWKKPRPVNGAELNTRKIVNFEENGEASSSTAPDGMLVSRKRTLEGYEFHREHLPIDDVESQILDILSKEDTCIFLGETGSGKSTQIPKMCVRASWCEGKMRIAVTQPRRVAAISLANRVSRELDCELGTQVGYRVRFEAVTSSHTKIVYMTDGILLREALHDPMLKEYGGVLVDEAHERSLHTDVLLSVLRQCQKARVARGFSPLKILIMSATIQCKAFSEYFGGASVNVIQGRTHPIELFYADAIDPTSSDYAFDAIVAVLQLHRQEPLSSDMLVFLTGREEIEIASKKVKEANKELEHPIHAVQLYAAMTNAAQMRAFEKAPPGHRKVIFATNIAETSLTIPGVRIVIDTGKVKVKTFTPVDRIDVLKVQPVSRAQALQRAGRAGREAPGKCYRLYPLKHYESMEENSVPEILRSNLCSVLMEMFQIGVKRLDKLKLIEEPDADALKSAVQQLVEYKAVKTKRNRNGTIRLSPTGHLLLKFPVAPEHARILLSASNHGCLEEALLIVACMSSETIFSNEGHGDAEDMERIRRRYQTNEGDHLTLLNVCNIFKNEKRNKAKNLKEFCENNFLNMRNLNTVMKVRAQLREICTQIEAMKIGSCGGNRDLIRHALADGLFMNACVYDRGEDQYKLMVNPAIQLKIHPSSGLARSKPRCFVFTDLVRTNNLYARDITLIDEEWVRPRVEEYRRHMAANLRADED